MFKKFPFLLCFILFIAASMASCVENSTTEDEEIEELEVDNKMIVIKDRLFSIPSPIHISMLIKEKDILYRDDLLNSTNNRRNYITNLEKALNLGVYGADLAYLYLYENYPKAREYFAIVEDLSKNLGLTKFVDENTLQRLKSNQNNKDSLLRITSMIFMKADAFLLDTERNDLAALILTGGWIESLYFLTKIQTKNDEIFVRRIAEQKHPLNNLIEIMRPYYGETTKEFNNVLEELVELATIYDGIDINYEYEDPITKKEDKITVINGNSSVIIPDDQLDRIVKKVEQIRTMIIDRK